MAHDHDTHAHDCFDAVKDSFEELRELSDRVGFFLYAADNDTHDGEDIHYRGNTAFASGVLRALINGTLQTHTLGACAHCDHVARALEAARVAFETVMSKTKGRC